MGKHIAEHKSLYHKERRVWYKEHGICPDCGLREPVPGRVTCEVCLKKYQKKQQAHPERNAQKKAMREARIAAGLCLQCGRPAIPGQRMCERCRMMRNDSSRKYKILKRMDKEAELARHGKGQVSEHGANNQRNAPDRRARTGA